jgi:hypothetical protein
MNTDNEVRREIQSKLGDYRAPVPADGWDRIEQSLNAARNARTIVRRRWYAASAVAAVILLVGGLLFVLPTSDEVALVSESSVSQTDSSHDSNPEVVFPKNAEQAVSPASVTPFRATNQIKKNTPPLTAYNKPDRNETWLQRGQTVLATPRRNIREEDFSSAVKKAGMLQTVPLTQDAGVEEYITVGREQEGLLKDQGQGRADNRQIVLAMSGRGGLTPFQQTVNSPMTLRSAQYAENNPPLSDSKMLLTTNNTAGNVSEMEHDQPVSFGITVSKSLFNDLSLETGLIYTHLSSKVRNSSVNLQVQETQRLHYLGIPLNVNYNLFSVKKVNVYASVGGMLEKDVYGEYRRKGVGVSPELNISSEEEEITRISQRNPQISVNAGVGVSFPVYQDVKLYGKIGGAYYFDANNEYKTIYSDSKIVMDLSVGLRYEFK